MPIPLAQFSHLNLISVLGIATMVGIAVLLSSDRKKINWRLVVAGLGLQVLFAAVFFNSQSWTFPKTFTSYQQLAEISDASEGEVANWPAEELLVSSILESKYATFADLKSAVQANELTVEQIDDAIEDGISIPRFKNGAVFFVVESFFAAINKSVLAGTEFVFGVFPDAEDETNKTHARAILNTFAFGILPTVVFFAALMSVLYHVGVMQLMVRAMAWLMQRTLGVSGAESLAAAANVLVGHTEAPLVVKPYVADMTRSELNALMVGGFATISGSLMAVFASMGVSAGHLLTASIISAPAALVLAKIIQPETETPKPVEAAQAKMDSSRATNVIQAAADGVTDGLKLALNIGAMLLAFLALIMFFDILLQGLAGMVGLELSLKKIFGWLFFPLAWIMGVETKDCMAAGDLLGQKMIVNEFVAYLGMIDEKNAALSERTQVILTYALCGFSNFGAIGIQLGGIGPLAPERQGDLAQLGLRAMFTGMLACCMTACIAGAMYGILR